jgi:hypothetical protein
VRLALRLPDDRPLRAVLLGLAVVLVTGCPERSAIWIVGQAEPGRPVFGIGRTVRGEPILIYGLMVWPCERFDGTARSTTWFLVSDGPQRVVDRVTYGHVPAGYASTHYMSRALDSTSVAPPLAPGCYLARLEASSGTVRFDVARDGSVLERPSEN